jgi:D-amino-acid oxidase
VSNVAAAFWYPYQVFPEDLIRQWAAVTHAELTRLSTVEGSGVLQQDTIELFTTKVSDPWWAELVPTRRASFAELPDGYDDGIVFPSPVAQMPIYLSYLEERFRRAGGTLSVREVATIVDVSSQCDVIVNCAGLGAAKLVGDTTMTPIRGQVVYVSQVGLSRTVFDQTGYERPVYIVPRSHDCVLGGTAEYGDDRLDPDPHATTAILERCIKLEPRLAGAAVLAERVGLRPGRPSVRVEVDDSSPGLLVHNYGHGGAGVALSWGCADAVVSLINAVTGTGR